MNYLNDFKDWVKHTVFKRNKHKNKDEEIEDDDDGNFSPISLKNLTPDGKT